MSRTEQAEADAQLKTLRMAMQNYYARAVLDRAKQTPQDARLAVNLSEVVKGNRGELSKQAFDLLHKLFPKSTAAQHSRYWYWTIPKLRACLI